LKPEELVYGLQERPFGRTWPKWAAIWCNWLLSIPKTGNPALDDCGTKAGISQTDPYAWFLAGTFGNENIVRRKCKIPLGKAILFPTMLKECSFAEDRDLTTESQLVERAKNDMDMIMNMEVTLSSQDPKAIHKIQHYRIQSELYDLKFPQDNVYDVTPGITRSVCSGYWVFLKPLPPDTYELFFRVEASLPEEYVVREQIRSMDVYRPVHEYIEANSSFKIEVEYLLTIE
jgi:hypothetical protein